MKRKHTVVLTAPGPRNPFVALAKFKRAGAHRKSEKTLRRLAKVQTGSVAQMDRAAGFYPADASSRLDRSTRTHFKEHSFWNVFCPGDETGKHTGSRAQVPASSSLALGTI
jgi:hypothetical protein